LKLLENIEKLEKELEILKNNQKNISKNLENIYEEINPLKIHNKNYDDSLVENEFKSEQILKENQKNNYFLNIILNDNYFFKN